MANLKEDDLKDLGLDIGEENVPQAVGGCGQCETCLTAKEHPDGCIGCEKCQTNAEQGCKKGENSCDTACQNGWQEFCNNKNEGDCGKCQRGCQNACEKSHQCHDCEYDCQSSYQRRCQYNCQDTCERNTQCGSCQGSCQSGCESRCQGTCEVGCQSTAQTNVAPTMPATLNVPGTVKGGDNLTIGWSASSDSNLAGYILEKKTDDGSFIQIYKGSNRSFIDTISVGVTKVQYRVRAYDTLNAMSAYKTSGVIAVINNVPPSISGEDKDLGGQKAPFKIGVTVTDKEGDTVNLIAKLNGTVLKTIENIKLDANYDIEIDEEHFSTLKLNARNEVEISASDTKATSYRRYYFTRTNAAPSIALEKSNYGLQQKPFKFTYTVRDAENDKTKIEFYHADKLLGKVDEVPLGEEQGFTLSKLDFAKIPSGDAGIKAVATDANGGSSVKYIGFMRDLQGCGYIYRKNTAKNATQIIVSVSAYVDDKSKLIVSVCNNARDENPAWEVIPNEDLEKIYNIKNTKKTTSNWAIGVKTEIVRGQDAGDSYLEAVAINYR